GGWRRPSALDSGAEAGDAGRCIWSGRIGWPDLRASPDRQWPAIHMAPSGGERSVRGHDPVRPSACRTCFCRSLAGYWPNRPSGGKPCTAWSDQDRPAIKDKADGGRGDRCRCAGTGNGRTGSMIPLSPSTRIYLACGATDMRKGFNGLAVLAQQVLHKNPHSGALFAFRGKRGDLVKLLWYDGQGMCLFSKRM